MVFPNRKAQEKWNISIVVAFLVILFGAIVLLLFTGWGQNKIKNSIGCEGWFAEQGLYETSCSATKTCPSGTKEDKGILSGGCGDGVCCRGKKGDENKGIVVAIDEDGDVAKQGQAQYDIPAGSAKFYFWGTGEVDKCTARLLEGTDEVATQSVNENCAAANKGSITYDFKTGKNYKLELKGFASSSAKVDEKTITIKIGAAAGGDGTGTGDEGQTGGDGENTAQPKLIARLSDKEDDLMPGTQYFTKANVVQLSVECEQCEIKLNDKIVKVNEEELSMGAHSIASTLQNLDSGFNTIELRYTSGENEWIENYYINSDTSEDTESYIVFNVATCEQSNNPSSCSYLQPDMTEGLTNPESSFITDQYIRIEYLCLGKYKNCKVITHSWFTNTNLEYVTGGSQVDPAVEYEVYKISDSVDFDDKIVVKLFYDDSGQKEYSEVYTIEYIKV
ncbi:MAG: hypothetical protein KKE20_04095 [Nanoarchaeota archaeon]|nr:hypothetical protein [Nanoarchaeota archaeon]